MEEWYSRGYLPHRDKPGLVQHITFRLADSLPYNVLERLKLELDIIRNELVSSLDASELDKNMKTEKNNRIEGYLDARHGAAILKNADFAIVVKNIELFKADLLTVQKYTRHKSVETLQVYNDNIEKKETLQTYYAGFDFKG